MCEEEDEVPQETVVVSEPTTPEQMPHYVRLDSLEESVDKLEKLTQQNRKKHMVRIDCAKLAAFLSDYHTTLGKFLEQSRNAVTEAALKGDDAAMRENRGIYRTMQLIYNDLSDMLSQATIPYNGEKE